MPPQQPLGGGGADSSTAPTPTPAAESLSIGPAWLREGIARLRAGRYAAAAPDMEGESTVPPVNRKIAFALLSDLVVDSGRKVLKVAGGLCLGR